MAPTLEEKVTVLRTYLKSKVYRALIMIHGSLFHSHTGPRSAEYIAPVELHQLLHFTQCLFSLPDYGRWTRLWRDPQERPKNFERGVPP